MPRVLLNIENGLRAGQTQAVESGQIVLIGRGSAAEVHFPDLSVSRIHARLAVSADRVLLHDTGSTCGTSCNEIDVTRVQIRDGDVIRFGDVKVQVKLLDPARTTTSEHRETCTSKAELVAFQPRRGSVANSGRPCAVQSWDRLGDTLLGYEVRELMARSASGVVFRGRDLNSGQDVALKVFSSRFSTTEETRRRLLRALGLSLPLRHPNLVSTLDYGEEQGQLIIVTEFVDGESATALLGRLGVGGMLDWRNAVDIAIGIARALRFAASQGLVHRNITPGNILICRADRCVKLNDITLTRAIAPTVSQEITGEGETIGPVAYMAPEQILSPHEVDERTDLYNLGAVLYHLLTGRPAIFGMTAAETVRLIPSLPVIRPSRFQLSIPPLLEDTIMRLLAKHREDRLPSAEELLTALDRVGQYTTR